MLVRKVLCALSVQASTNLSNLPSKSFMSALFSPSYSLIFRISWMLHSQAKLWLQFTSKIWSTVCVNFAFRKFSKMILYIFLEWKNENKFQDSKFPPFCSVEKRKKEKSEIFEYNFILPLGGFVLHSWETYNNSAVL